MRTRLIPTSGRPQNQSLQGTFPNVGCVDTFPQVPLKAPDQINAYEDSIIGLNEGERVRIDIYGYILNKKASGKSRFALFWCKKRALGDLVQTFLGNR